MPLVAAHGSGAPVGARHRWVAFIAAGLQAMRAFSNRTAGPVIGHLLLGLIDQAAGVVALA